MQSVALSLQMEGDLSSDMGEQMMPSPLWQKVC